MAWASAITPILIGSAANAVLAPSPMAVAAKRAGIDQELRCDIFIVMIDFPLFFAQMGGPC
jgi:Na+-translocating ferredoxin:NAD+ oxidoreductase RnfE subunit